MRPVDALLLQSSLTVMATVLRVCLRLHMRACKCVLFELILFHNRTEDAVVSDAALMIVTAGCVACCGSFTHRLSVYHSMS